MSVGQGMNNGTNNGGVPPGARRASASLSQPSSVGNGLDSFDDFFGGPSGGSPNLMGGAPAAPPPRAASRSVPANSSGMGAFGEPDLFGAAPPPVTDANGELSRAALAARRQAETQAAIDEKR